MFSGYHNLHPPIKTAVFSYFSTRTTTRSSFTGLIPRMRLSALVPSISADSVAHLEACGIRTDSDLLFTPTLEIFRKLPPNSLTLQDLVHICTTVTGLCTAEPVLATELLVRAEAHETGSNTELQVGDDQIDRLLHGLGCRRIIEISGDKGSGKSVRSALLRLCNNFKLHRSWPSTSRWVAFFARLTEPPLGSIPQEISHLV